MCQFGVPLDPGSPKQQSGPQGIQTKQNGPSGLQNDCPLPPNRHGYPTLCSICTTICIAI